MSKRITAFTMPKWGLEMQEGTISEWHAREGDQVSAGEAIAAVETDKIVNDVEAPATGVLRRVLGEVGATYPVGALLAVVADPEVDDAMIDDFLQSGVQVPAASGSTVDAAEAGNAGAAQGAHHSAENTDAARATENASPKAQRVARELGVDLTCIRGTGRHGRITLQDVEQAAKAASADAPACPFTVETLSGKRLIAARRLVRAKQEIPHFYLRRQVDVQPLIDLQRSRKSSGAAGSLNDYLIRACALALCEVPDINAQLHGDELRKYRSANIAVAMQLDSGLITPVIKACEDRDVADIASESRRLSTAAEDGSLSLGDLEEASFTLSNLGMFGVDEFDAIVNPPAVAILAVGRARPTAVVDEAGQVAVGSCLQLSLSCDHRAVDGALGATFLDVLAERLGAPESLLE